MAKNQRMSAAGKMERNPERFYCPYPNCTRSFAELWRLKVHYRAPPDARGSGKERGHGCELQQCPKCEKELKQGRHHVGCFANKGSNTKKRPQKVADEHFADPEEFVGMNRHYSTPVPSVARPPSGIRHDQNAPAPTHIYPFHQAPRPMSTAMSEPLEPAMMKRKLTEEFVPRKRSVPNPDFEPELLGIPATGSFLMGGRANTLPPPSASKLAEQPAPIFERFSSSSEDTPAAHDQRPGSAPELNHFHTIFDDDMMAGLLDYDQGGLQSEGFALPEGFGLPDEGPVMATGPSHRSPPLPREGFGMHNEGISLPPRAMAARGLGKAHSASLASVYHIQANCSHELSFQAEDRRMAGSELARLLDGEEDFPDVPHSMLADMAPSLAPIHHRRAASCGVPQRSSADENIMMQGGLGRPFEPEIHSSMAQQQQIGMATQRSASHAADLLPYCNRSHHILPTIHSFPSLNDIYFSSDESPKRNTHGRHTSSSASSEYEDTELVHTEKTSVSRKGNVYELDIFNLPHFPEFEQSLDATFAFGASSMVGHSPQTPQDMYSIGKGGNAMRWSPQSEQTHAHGSC